MSDIYTVILAAGKGTRMKSKLYKVLHPVCGKPMVQHVVDNSRQMKPKDTVLVIGHGADKVKEELGPDVTYVLQEEQLGTGHAVMVTRDHLLDKNGTTLILYGDTPLVTADVLQQLVNHHHEVGAAATILTAQVSDPTGYGRVVRNEHADVTRIVEQKDATPEEQQIKEINTGMYCFDNQKLVSILPQLTNDNVQGEYYITDCIEILKKQEEKVSAYITPDADITMGVNDRVALAEAEKKLRKRLNEQHMREGVTIIDPDHTYIGVDVKIGQDTVIHPGTSLSGQTVIGEDCVIGPNADIRDAQIGEGTTVQHSTLTESTVGEQTTIGPYAYIRPGSDIGDNCKIGDFVEVKNAVVGDGAKIPHLSYIGDADIGKKVNMGCGSITVNYDGQQKHRTVVEEGSFVGCNVNLIAPVEVGKGSYIAAGSTINRSVPENSLAIAREKQTNKEGYASRLRAKNKK
ncbi:bifunctional UDP-N-acetylglucosamine diphosphorylase/glucosamine-1-phosphate N-acetyltransferase GlmU [Caldalkalibacillus salinus]|uniref:bifunctional UDP-N-acetylglucosamine diphosphorylase/glucosamine-1-phosphate N-acetyltransferase GlmU n=1 Tax=Caldalkalibacillus salinus TaxID=2803787 RepID=UPI0019216530|nr:bifunctional UDP-N-acetylglucosamine diphosphorylase/glucosamine-1-phosphate N-acetyltransferase GlmU [Caldalkalibacillus salinus]